MSSGDHEARGLLICGRFAELEDALAERVLELRRGRPLEPLTIVVGSASVRTRTTDLLIRRLGAVANVSVVTLARLALDLVTQARGAPPTVLDGLARERLLRRCIERRAAEGLAYYGPVSTLPHFAQALAATFADLREAGIPPGSGWAVTAMAGHAASGGMPVPARPASRAGVGAPRAARATDLEALYAEYCAELELKGVLDAAQVQIEAAETVAVDGGPGHSILYGLYDVNMAQEAFVRALARRGADLLVPVPRGGGAEPATTMATGRSLELDERVVSPPPATTALARLAGFSGASSSAAGPLELIADGTLAVVSVADERGEAREATRAVLEAAGRGVPFWDCAVVVPHGDDVERLAAALEAAGVPVACGRSDRGVGARVLRRLVECLAPDAGRPSARRAVVDLLTAAPLRGGEAAPREAARWLDEARRAGVVAGLDEWIERLERHRRGLRQRLERDDLEARAAAGDNDAEPGSALQLRVAAVRSLERAVRALAASARGLPEQASWARWAEGLTAVAEAVFDDPTAAAVSDVVGRLRALDVLDEEVDAREVAAVLRELLGRRKVPEGRATRKGVAIVTPLELRGHRFGEVVFAGLAEGGFPSRGRPDPILGDAERRRLTEAFGARLPLAEERDAESGLLFAFACEAARERLTLLSPRTDAGTGRPRLPSRLLLRVASQAAGYSVTLDEFLSGAPLRAVWRRTGAAPAFDAAAKDDITWIDARELDDATLLGLSGGGRAAAHAYLAAVLDDEGAAGRRLAQWRAGRRPDLGAWDGLLGAEARAVLARRHPFTHELHPTRLERYIGCPFAFFLHDVLGLDTPEEPGESLEIGPLEYGTLAHDILEVTYRRVIDEGLDRQGALAAVAAAWEQGCAEAESHGVTGTALAWEVRRDTLLDDLLESVRRDRVFDHEAEHPIGVEWRFGERYGTSVTLELPDGRAVRFAGRLDRVDVTPSGARVIDYKTGRGATEERRIKDGLSVQLPVYQLAVRQTSDAAYGDVRCLYRLVTRKGGFKDLTLPDDEDRSRERLRALAAEMMALVDQGLFPRTSRNGCDYCDIRYACGFSAWARARKREHERLADLVRLQTEGPEEVGPDGED